MRHPDGSWERLASGSSWLPWTLLFGKPWEERYTERQRHLANHSTFSRSRIHHSLHCLLLCSRLDSSMYWHFTGNTRSRCEIWTVTRENPTGSFYCLSPGKVLHKEEEQLQYGGTVYRRIFKMQGGVGKKTIPITTYLTSVPRAEGV